ncbi:replication associated protein [Faeces associated gemycircularvirus 19]|uniref:Replication-associated protein n=1 Tax=Faeces associated gemycircularvirus 19 TaxID=1843739 RepID=A0A168MGA2_9VIRU|nr:replication associated protein [Faeces associated gemycircularvirus 19]ANC51601.1 replication associated protein [Faeces associated gemycircularvirus 19]
MSAFHFSARYVLLTYPQSGELSEWAVLDHISGLGAECIIGREDHADGGTHLHVFADFGRKKQSRRGDYFDVGGKHPNVVPSKGRPEGGWDYATKDGNVVAGGLGRPGTSGLPKAPNPWREIVGAEGREEFLDLVRQLDPKSFVLKHQEIVRYADIFFAEDREPYVGPDGIRFELGMVPQLDEWRRESLGDNPVEGKSRSLVLYGPSRLGKTIWARSLGPHVYIMGLLSGAVLLRDAPGASYAVFDDMRGGLPMFPSFKEWFGSQSLVTVKKMYRDPVQMRWGKPCIWLANSDPRDQLKADITDRTPKGRVDLIYEDIAWLEANCVFVELSEPIFRANMHNSPE